jgi:predicted TIM-barrel fold metal-dependent hydrolase
MIDIHTHVWREGGKTNEKLAIDRCVTWPSLVAKDNSIEDLAETYKLMFPDKDVTPLIFPTVPDRNNELEANRYVEESGKKYHYPALIFSMPEWTAEVLEEKIIRGGFLGIKSYLSLAPDYIPEKEIRIFDFFPRCQLEVLNRHGWILMLHIPRDGRLKDPVNLAQMMEIEENYPGMKVIIAHVGRAYCPEDVGNAFDILSKTKNMMFDFCANTNEFVFEKLIKAVGPKRILFGSDMPILRMRTRRICESGNYVNLVPKGLYGDVSKDRHMREVEKEEADRLTFFMYEEIDAFRRAAAATGLSAADIEDVFYNNSRKLIESTGFVFSK